MRLASVAKQRKNNCVRMLSNEQGVSRCQDWMGINEDEIVFLPQAVEESWARP